MNVPVGIHSLTAERIGYRSVTSEVTVTAGGTTVQDFALSQEALGLDEIIVTGTPGGTQRRTIWNSVISVSASEVVQTVVVSDISDLMVGRTPGLQFKGMTVGVGNRLRHADPGRRKLQPVIESGSEVYQVRELEAH